MSKNKTNLSDLFNIGNGFRELKLGQTFKSTNTSTAFHTVKYDFKPASVDTNKLAEIDITSNKQVTITAPNLERSPKPHTVYKGNHKEYTRECVLIIDKKTGDITLEKLEQNIQVKNNYVGPPLTLQRFGQAKRPSCEKKSNIVGPPPKLQKFDQNLPVDKSRSGIMNKHVVPPATLKNITRRTFSKFEVSTGSRTRSRINYAPRKSMNNDPVQKIPQKTPELPPFWNPNIPQKTQPSISMAFDHDDGQFSQSGGSTGSQRASSTSSTSSFDDFVMPEEKPKRIKNNRQQQLISQQHQKHHQHQQQQHQKYQQNNGMCQNSNGTNSNLGRMGQRMPRKRMPAKHVPSNSSTNCLGADETLCEKPASSVVALERKNGMVPLSLGADETSCKKLPSSAATLEWQKGVVNSSDSKSKSDSSSESNSSSGSSSSSESSSSSGSDSSSSSSDSESDSEDIKEDNSMKLQNYLPNLQVQQQQPDDLNYDLQLSESDSSDE